MLYVCSMKTQTRKGVFETNSSSTHSICIAKDNDFTIGNKVHFKFGKFGWEEDTLNSLHEKASYLYTGLYANNRKEQVAEMIDLLKSKGVEVLFEEPIYGEPWIYEDKEYTPIDNGGYVDHSDELTEFLDAMKDEQKLLSYLFSDLSYILTGNDNSDSDIEINVKYPHEVYYKGN